MRHLERVSFHGGSRAWIEGVYRHDFVCDGGDKLGDKLFAL